MTIWQTDYVIKNPFSRPGFKLLGVRGLVLHWTADPGASDENEKKFFDGSDGGGGRAASAHIFVDSDSATLILPLDEVGYHANDHACKIAKLKGSIVMPNGKTYAGDANVTTIGVEMCVEKDGSIHPETVKRTVQVMAELCKMYKLNPQTDIYRHFDITGKNCPAPYVANPSLFTAFKNNVQTAMNPPKDGWINTASGWTYYQNGTQFKSKWVSYQGHWYFMKDSGIMAAGEWVQYNGKYYYLDANGMMHTGWFQEKDHWYYLDLTNGDMKTGWVKDTDGKWYYMNPNTGGPQGSMMTGWITDAGKKYYLNPVSGGPKGSMVTGKVTIDGKSYTFASSGALQS